MYFPKFWASYADQGVSCWGWSDQSPADAEWQARTRLQRIREVLSRNSKSQKDTEKDAARNRYDYGERPLREQVIKELSSTAPENVAVITRNSYGCLVLNASSALFVDVDLKSNGDSQSVAGFLMGLFGKKSASKYPADLEAALTKAEAWAKRNPSWGWRVYRTKAGLRFLAIHSCYEPGDRISTTVFQELDADPLYQKLCKDQKCFRARLTPKPWRCGVEKPPNRWPWKDAKEEQTFLSWQEKYQQASASFATCEFITTIGSESPHLSLQNIVAVHDDMTRATSGLPLA